MEQQSRKPGTPIGPEAQQTAFKTPHRGVFGRLLEKARVIRPHSGYGPEAGKVVVRGGVVTAEGAYGEASAASQSAPAEVKSFMPPIAEHGVGKSNITAVEVAPTHVMQGGTLMSTNQAKDIAERGPQYPSARDPEREPFTGGSAIPSLPEEQFKQAVGPVGPNSVTPPAPAPQELPEGVVHNLPIDGQRRY